MLKRVTAVLGGAIAVVAVTLFVLFLAEQVSGSTPTVDVRPAILLAGLVGFNCITYVVWLNRWNIVAHTALAFSIVAYIIPIVFLNQMDGLSSAAIDLYYQVMAAGLLFGVIGVLLGAAAGGSYNVEKLRAAADFESDAVRAKIRKRVMILGALSVAGVFVAFLGMGFIPMLTPDPLTAKFFRGAYAAAYQPVAPLYRGATSILAVILPVIFLYAVKLKSFRAAAVAATATLALFLGLMREPAVSGVLLLLGVYMAVRRKPWFGYFLLLVGGYFVGGALYYLLALIGIGGFEGSPGAQTTNLLEQAAAGAPDIRDHITFLTAWLQRPEFSYGLTWFGGLIPGNSPFNPSVWSLRVVNPTQDITAIASGGLRLPPPIWGMVSFGWAGVIVVSLLTGFIQGYLANVAKRVMPSRSIEISLYWLVIYVALVEVLPAFFRFSYLSVLQLIVILLVFRWRTRPAPEGRRGRTVRSDTRAVPAR
ncbi:hypothetical protein [Microbacterium aurantiacum]|uniref:hypothetical protein n=1 Tax=Microbacterium aurantiacum TaxID=162393 RepID=UPI0034253BB2